MSLLLDTHAFLWWVSDRGRRLSDRARQAIAESEQVMFSAASAFEIATKAERGRLELPFDASRYVPDRIARHGLVVLPVRLDHAIRAGLLPTIHRDPWDRLLVAQAQLEGVPILSADPAVAQYDVETIW